MKKLALFIGAAMSVSLLFAGCSTTSNDTSSSVSESVESEDYNVAGTTWHLVDGDITDPNTGEMIYGDDLVDLIGSLSVTFNEDGTFVFSYGDMTSEGVYEQDGSTVTVTERSGELASFSVEGGIMIWDINDNLLILSKD